jgi:hypothetical protein
MLLTSNHGPRLEATESRGDVAAVKAERELLHCAFLICSGATGFRGLIGCLSALLIPV